MADKRIRDLDAGTALTSSHEFPADKTGLTEAVTYTADDIANYTVATTALAEKVRDTIGTAIVGGTGITATVNDAGDTITIDADDPTTATAVALKANIASPTFTGTPAAPTPPLGGNDTSIATTAFVARNAAEPRPAPGLPIELPTPDADQSVTHPSVVHVDGGWKGYRYWMAYTPWPDASRENPCIACSNDGVTWILPIGAPNPLVTNAQIVTDGYLYGSDTELVLVNDHLWCYYRPYKDSGGTNTEAIWLTTSADGVTWTARQQVVTNTSTFPSAASPSIVEEADGTFTMWCTDRTGSSPYALTRRTSADGLSWGSPSNCTMPAGIEDIWHVTVKLVHGTYYALLNTSSPSRLIWLTSADGITWTGSRSYCIPLVGVIDGDDLTDGGHYRSAMVPVAGDPLRWDIWVACRRSGSGDWRIVLYRNLEMPVERYGNDHEAAYVFRAANNAWIVTPHASQTTAGLGAGNMRLTPIFLPTCTIDEIGCEITTGVASSVCRVGIYRDNSFGRPGALVISGTIDSTSTGFKYATVTATKLTAGLYWLALHSDTAASGIGYRCCNAGSPIQMAWSSRPDGSTLSGGISGFIMGSITPGAMPTTFVITSHSAATPIMWVHTTTNSRAI